MSTNFPTTLDTFTGPAGGSLLSASIGGRTHSQMHTDLGDAIAAVQAKIGVNGSGVSTSLDNRIANLEVNRLRRVANLIADATLNNSVANLTIASGSLDMADATLNRVFEIEAAGIVLNNTGANQSLTLRFQINGVDVYVDTTAVFATSAQARAWHLKAMLRLNPTAQRVGGIFTIGGADAVTTPASTTTSGGIGAVGVAHAFAASPALVLSTSGFQNLTAMLTMSAASANFTITATIASVRQLGS